MVRHYEPPLQSTKSNLSFQIIYGLHDLDNPAGAKYMSLTKKNVITHPKFHDPTPYNNDIALIKLNKPLRKTDYIQPVCIPRKDLKTSNVLYVIPNNTSLRNALNIP